MDIPDDSLDVMANGLLSTKSGWKVIGNTGFPATGWLKKLVFHKTAATDKFIKKESFVFEMK